MIRIFILSPGLKKVREKPTNRRASNTAGTLYFKTGAYALLGLSADYRFADKFDVNVGVKNLTDENYQLMGGFPEAGRTFFAELRFRQ